MTTYVNQDLNRISKTIHVNRDGIVSIDLSSPLHSEMGKVLHKVYYGTQIPEVAGNVMTGYPHNGGEHTMRLRGTKGDVLAVLDLISDIKFEPLTNPINIFVGQLNWIAQDIIKVFSDTKLKNSVKK